MSGLGPTAAVLWIAGARQLGVVSGRSPRLAELKRRGSAESGRLGASRLVPTRRSQATN